LHEISGGRVCEIREGGEKVCVPFNDLIYFETVSLKEYVSLLFLGISLS